MINQPSHTGLGWDFAGTVLAAGLGVDLAVETRVAGVVLGFDRDFGTYAEQLVVPVADLAVVPDGALRCGRVLDNFPTIIGKLAAMVDRFTTTLDCVDHTFIGDDLLDRLPALTQIGATRVGGVDLNKPRIRAALSAVLALSAASGGFTVAEFITKAHAMTGNTGYTIRARRLRPAQTRREGADRQTRPDPPLPPHTPERGHHRRPVDPARARHRAHPGWRAQPTQGTQAHRLDQRRPRLREDPHRHANPLQRPGHLRRRIDNILSIGVS